MGNSAAKEAASRCPPTCPAVDLAFGELEAALEDLVPPSLVDAMKARLVECCGAVKDCGTHKLRSALVWACEDYQRAEELREDLQRDVDDLREEVESLRAEIRQMEKEAA